MNENPAITDPEFAQFQKLIYKIAGISLADSKQVLLVGRLGRRLKHYGMASFTEYYRSRPSIGCPDARRSEKRDGTGDAQDRGNDRR